jgi:hypothetical protein
MGPSPQFSLELVPSNLHGMSVALVVMGIAHLLKVLYIPPSSSAIRVIMAMMAGTS